mmetsp:Transcript_25092/g.58933  ORF Transcript_25092/g.58933 Transcript_25092/m.58933 type:complete len:215 (+) Transcript_25092:478-1122(+)
MWNDQAFCQLLQPLAMEGALGPGRWFLCRFGCWARGICAVQDALSLLEMRDVHHLPFETEGSGLALCRLQKLSRLGYLLAAGRKSSIDHIDLVRMDRKLAIEAGVSRGFAFRPQALQIFQVRVDRVDGLNLGTLGSQQGEASAELKHFQVLSRAVPALFGAQFSRQVLGAPRDGFDPRVPGDLMGSQRRLRHFADNGEDSRAPDLSAQLLLQLG